MDPRFVKHEIPLLVVRRIIDQHQMRQVAVRQRQPIEWKIAPHIAIDHQERVRAQHGQSAENPATGLQRRMPLLRKMQSQVPELAVGQRIANLLTEPGKVNHHIIDTRS
ncbi:hypothetical protein MnTg04_01445 [bacterium MnTg04]|nr:hypothetical protein MnTg04_01445 [bacterium MnTg04]